MNHWSACSASCGPGTRSRKLKGIPSKHGGLPCTDEHDTDEHDTVEYDDGQRQLFGLIPSHGNGGHDYVRLEKETCNIKECAGESFSYYHGAM